MQKSGIPNINVIDFQLSAPAAPPALVNHSEVTSTSVTLAWAPPPTDQHNGVIRHYLVFVIEEDTGRNFTLTSFHAELSVSELHPFYNYHFAVAAFTVAVGPYTQQHTVRTEEDGKRCQTTSMYISPLGRTLCLDLA